MSEKIGGYPVSHNNEVEKNRPSITWQEQPLRLDDEDAWMWSGGVKLDESRLRKHSLGEYMAMANDFYVQTGTDRPERCIDGRPKEGVMDLSNLQNALRQKLGPQTPGGSPVAALCHRIAEFDQLPAGDIYQDLLSAQKRYEATDLPFPVGAHEDDHAKHPDTGCGAIDRMPEIMGRIVDGEARPVIKHYVHAICGGDFNQQAFDDVLARYQILNQKDNKVRYLLGTTGEYEYKNLTVEAIKRLQAESNGSGEPSLDETGNAIEAVETMVGPHNEIMLIVNKIPNTTFHRDWFCLESRRDAAEGEQATANGKVAEAQAFNYDYWLSVERADALYGNDRQARQEFLLARAIYAVATAMVLTDGSLAVGIRE